MGLGEKFVELFRNKTPQELKMELGTAYREAERAATNAKRAKENAYEQFKGAVKVNAGEYAKKNWAATYDQTARMETAANQIAQYAQHMRNVIDLGGKYVDMLKLTKKVTGVARKLSAKTGNTDKILGEAQAVLEASYASGEKISDALQGFQEIGQSTSLDDRVRELEARAQAELAQETVAVTGIEAQIAAEKEKDQQPK